MTPTMDDIYEEARRAVKNIAPALRELSMELHLNPETGFSESKAHALLTKFLKKEGFNVTDTGVANLPTAFIAKFKNDGEEMQGRRVGLCSEYDALPEIGHACGHNLIAVVGVAAAIGVRAALKKYALPGEVSLFGTPAEESAGGKINMIDAALFEGLDACVMAHPGNNDGTFGTYLAIQAVVVEYFGKASHAAVAPWEGVNALDALVTAYQAIGLMRQQMLPTNRVHGIVTHGGSAPNIIPDYARGHFNFRARTWEQLDEMYSRAVDIFESAGKTARCRTTLTWNPAFLDVRTNAPLAEHYQTHMTAHATYPFYPCNDTTSPNVDQGVGDRPQCAKDDELPLLDFPTPEEMENVSLGSTDMGNVTHVVPGLHAMFNLGTKESLHTAAFCERAATRAAHAAAMRAAAGLACILIDVLLDDVFAKRVRENFEK